MVWNLAIDAPYLITLDTIILFHIRFFLEEEGAVGVWTIYDVGKAFSVPLHVELFDTSEFMT